MYVGPDPLLIDCPFVYEFKLNGLTPVKGHELVNEATIPARVYSRDGDNCQVVSQWFCNGYWYEFVIEGATLDSLDIEQLTEMGFIQYNL